MDSTGIFFSNQGFMDLCKWGCNIGESLFSWLCSSFFSRGYICSSTEKVHLALVSFKCGKIHGRSMKRNLFLEHPVSRKEKIGMLIFLFTVNGSYLRCHKALKFPVTKWGSEKSVIRWRTKIFTVCPHTTL